MPKRSVLQLVHSFGRARSWVYEEIRGDDTFLDPDDRVDPDERSPRTSVISKQPVGEIYALPAAGQSKQAGAIPILWSNQPRHNRLLERQQRRQALHSVRVAVIEAACLPLLRVP